jgi:hypothetical protein
MMSFILSWRRVVLVCVLLIAAAGVVGAWRSCHRRVPMPKNPRVRSPVISNGILVTASNGHATLPVSINDGIFGITWTGSAPRVEHPEFQGKWLPR